MLAKLLMKSSSCFFGGSSFFFPPIIDDRPPINTDPTSFVFSAAKLAALPRFSLVMLLLRALSPYAAAYFYCSSETYISTPLKPICADPSWLALYEISFAFYIPKLKNIWNRLDLFWLNYLMKKIEI